LLNFFKKRQKIKAIPLKDRHKPSLILNFSKKKDYKRERMHLGENINFKGILFGLLAFGIILGIVFLLISFFQISNYKLEKVSILGNKTITDQEINESIAEFKGNHISLINAKDIEAKLQKDFQIINGVQVTKQYPNKIFIKINEREAKLVYVSLNGAYVLDSNGKILKNLAPQIIDFSPEKILIARGLGDVNSQILQDYFLNEFILINLLGEKTLLEREQLIAAGYSFANITLAQKTAVLKKLSTEYQKEIDDIFAKNSGIVLGSKYRDFPEVYSLQNEELNSNASVDLERQNLSIELINRLNASETEYSQIRWEGSILVKVFLKNNKQLVFGSSRSLSEQWEDYLLVLNDLTKRGKGYSIIDISSTKISVIN